jgi:hypothetical protein
MPRANWKVLQEYRVPIPPENTLVAANELLDAIVSNVINTIFRVRTTRIMRDMLLPKLVHGRLDLDHLSARSEDDN